MISIIIPIYNVAIFLHQCIDSVLQQDYEDIEIILVNDGSTDDSLEICQKYAESNNNIIVIDKENSGPSDARNAGMAVAQGEYIYFLDGDDWLAHNTLRTLYEYAVATDCEVVQGGAYYAYNDHLYYDDGGIKASTTLSRMDAMRELILNKRIKNFAWGKLFRAEIVKRHPFPVGKIFEDCYWKHLVVHETTKYGIVPTPLYYYRQHSDSLTGTISDKGIDLLKGQEERLQFVRKEYPLLTKDMFHTYLNTIYIYYRGSLSNPDKELHSLYEKYWDYMVRTYDEQMKHTLGKEYSCRKQIVRWHFCYVYDLVVRTRNRIKRCFTNRETRVA